MKNKKLLLIAHFLNLFAEYRINKSFLFFIRSVWNFAWTPHLAFGNFYFKQNFLYEEIFINKVVQILFSMPKNAQNGA